MISARAPKNDCSYAARWKRDDVKKISLNNLNRLSRDFFFVEKAEEYRWQMQWATLRRASCSARGGHVLFRINFFSLVISSCLAKSVVDTCWKIGKR